jgi:hypothetical protein
MRKVSIYIFILLLSANTLEAQKSPILVGKVVDAFTKEPIPFATLTWNLSKKGVVADSVGHFKLNRSTFPKDSLMVSYVGFEPNKYALHFLKKDTLLLTLDYLNANYFFF